MEHKAIEIDKKLACTCDDAGAQVAFHLRLNDPKGLDALLDTMVAEIAAKEDN